jgi:hypothetical protein
MISKAVELSDLGEAELYDMGDDELLYIIEHPETRAQHDHTDRRTAAKPLLSG